MPITFHYIMRAGWWGGAVYSGSLVAAIAGWGKIAIPDPRNCFWLYIMGPLVGGPLGGAIFEFVVGRGLRPNLEKKKQRRDQLYATSNQPKLN